MADSETDENQATINKIHIEWLVRHVNTMQTELRKQTFLIYTMLITIIGALIGAVITIV